MINRMKKSIATRRRGFWFTTHTGQHIYVDENETPKQACERVYKEKETSKKIASVKIEVGKDNVLPELNEKELKEMGLTENKPVLVKKSSIERNMSEHADVKPEDFDFMIGNTLYAPDKIVKGKNPDRSYYSFAKRLKISVRNNRPLYGIVLLDVDKTKDNFEVVHWHWVNEDRIKSI